MENYKFIESISFITEFPNIVKDYDYILKTDCDVFLTKYIKDLNPTYTLVGRGHYNFENQEVNIGLERISKELNLVRNQNLTNIGSEFISNTNYTIFLMQETFKVTKYLLEKEFKNNFGKWPGWFKGVSSMYAFDICVNHYINQDFWYAGLGLSPYLVRKISNHDYHIHAFPSVSDFSKDNYFNKKYDPDFYKTKDKDTIVGYCFNVAYLTIDELIKKYN